MVRTARRWTAAEVSNLTNPQFVGLDLASGPDRTVRATVDPALAAIAREQRKAERQKLEALMWQHLVWLNLACLFDRHARFHPVRKWELDLLARGYNLGVEIHGGTHTGGRHVRGVGFGEDRLKMNAAIERGISVLEFTSDQVQDGTAASQIERVLCGRGWKGKR